MAWLPAPDHTPPPRRGDTEAVTSSLGKDRPGDKLARRHQEPSKPRTAWHGSAPCTACQADSDLPGC